jgi:hypothetical protein
MTVTPYTPASARTVAERRNGPGSLIGAPVLYAFRYNTRGKVSSSVGRLAVLEKTGWVWAAFVLLFATFVVLIFMQLQRPDAAPWGGEKALAPVKEVSHDPPPAAPEVEAPDYRPEY